MVRSAGHVQYTMVAREEENKDGIELQTISLGARRGELIGDEETKTSINSQSRAGWRKGILGCIGAAILVLVFAIVFMGWVTTRATQSRNFSVLFQGNCKKAKNMSIAAHVLINVLSTVLLGASNYCMQILSAPSRRDIDRMHARKTVMAIGLNSVGNIFKLAWDRRLVWVLFGLSSIPLHLVANSVVYSTTSAYSYTASVVTTGFFEGRSWVMNDYWWNDWSKFTGVNDPGTDWHTWIQSVQDNEIQLKRLDNKACIEAYTSPFITNLGNLLLVTDKNNFNTTNYANSSLLTALYGGYNYSLTSYNWMCGKSGFDTAAQNWHVPPCQNLTAYPDELSVTVNIPLAINTTNGAVTQNATLPTLPIEYCLSQELPERCTLEASVHLLAVVIVFIICKLVCMIWVLWRLKEHPLAVLGDAIASFVQRPDETTSGACLGTPDLFQKTRNWRKEQTWFSTRRRWGSAVSGGQWTACCVLFIGALSVAIGLFIWANMRLLQVQVMPLTTSGFGTLTPAFMLLDFIKARGDSASALVAAVLLANSPQLIASFIYVCCNSVFTSMLMGLEWSQFAHTKKPLRVSYPAGQQRTTYRLQIPYRYAVVLMMVSGSMHLLISQSIYLVRLRIYNFGGVENPDASISTCGYSLVALLATIVFGAVALIGLIATGCRRYRPGMTIVKGNSAAISAACHSRSDEGEDAALQPLQWGAVPSDDEIGHCCFGTDSVSLPKEGKTYA